MANLTMKEMECLQRGLGIVEGVAAGLPENVASILITAVEIIESGFTGGTDHA